MRREQQNAEARDDVSPPTLSRLGACLLHLEFLCFGAIDITYVNTVQQAVQAGFPVRNVVAPAPHYGRQYHLKVKGNEDTKIH